jgi:anti-anti-sigma factor
MMGTYPAARCLETEQIGQVVVVTFTQAELLEEGMIQGVGQQLALLADNPHNRHIVLNLGPVRKLSTTLIGQVLALHHKVRSSGGRIALCGIDPGVYRIFTLLKLNRLLPIYVEEQEALQTF